MSRPRKYELRIEVSEDAFRESSRPNFQTMVRLEAERRAAEFEKTILEDWDEMHRDPMKEFASALNTSLADAKRRSRSKEDGDEK